MILVAGCSFLDKEEYILGQRFGTTDIKNIAESGAGNTFISDRIIYEILHNAKDIEYVFVLWTGIMRHDLVLGTEVAKSELINFPSIGTKSYVCSGGFANSWQKSKSKTVKDFFKMYYKEPEREFFDNETIQNIYKTKCVLDANNIKYDFGSIYDPTSDYADVETSLGKAFSNDILKYYDIKLYPYDYCKKNNMLTKDNFHPTRYGLAEWFKMVKLKIDK